MTTKLVNEPKILSWYSFKKYLSMQVWDFFSLWRSPYSCLFFVTYTNIVNSWQNVDLFTNQKIGTSYDHFR